MFVPLHIYTSYSFLQSGFTVPKLVKALKDKQYKSAAITDFQVLFGVPEFFNFAKKEAIEPIIGLDVRVHDELITLLAINEVGYLNLIKISNASFEGHLDLPFLKVNQTGLIAIISSKQGQFISYFDNEPTKIVTTLKDFAMAFDRFYLGIEIYSDNDLPFAEHMRQVAEKYNYEPVAFPFIKYIKSSDAITLLMTHAIAHDERISIKQKSGPYYLYDKSMIAQKYNEQEISNSSLIASLVKFDFNHKRGSLLKYPLDENTTSSLTLRTMAIEGLQKREIDFTNIEYLQRLDYELRTIDELGYNDYFLIVADYVAFAKKEGIVVGPGRGSAPGSLVSYAIGITNVDPIEHNLLFERFLNSARKSMPDIDIDFADVRREEIINYLINKYGANRVANIITFQTIQAKQAIRDIGRIYEYSPRTIDAMSKALADGKYDLRTSFKRLPAFKKIVLEQKECLEIVKLATRIEGLIRQSGMHPAGVILNETPIDQCLPTLKANGHLISQYEMNHLESQGFLKMDILGLRNLTIINRCLAFVNEIEHLNWSINDIPYDDEKALTLIRSGLTMGIFQLESEGMRKAISEIKPTTFEDIVVILAIFRPGPMENIASYAARKAGTENVSILDTQLNDILLPTYGIIIYQEQIMQIAERMAGFSLAEADLFRSAVSKKNADKLKELQTKFTEGAIRKGYHRNHAMSVFNHIYKFADYGFNKSHSVAYAMLACQMAYLKAHYPRQFYAAILDTSSALNDDKFNSYIEELTNLKVTIQGPDINNSLTSFSVYDNKLLFPLTAIRLISNELANAIIKERESKPYSSFFDFLTRLFNKKITAKQIENLIDAGAFDKLHKSRATLRASIDNGLANAAIHSSFKDEPTLLEKPPLPSAKLIVASDDMVANVDREYAALGIVISDSPFKHKRKFFKNAYLISIKDIKDQKNNVTIGGIIRAIRPIKTKTGLPMAFLTIYDDTGDCDIVLFPSQYGEIMTTIAKNKLIMINGRVDVDKPSTVIANKVTLIEEN